MFDYIMGDAYEELTNLVRDDARRIINENHGVIRLQHNCYF